MTNQTHKPINGTMVETDIPHMGTVRGQIVNAHRAAPYAGVSVGGYWIVRIQTENGSFEVSFDKVRII